MKKLDAYASQKFLRTIFGQRHNATRRVTSNVNSPLGYDVWGDVQPIDSLKFTEWYENITEFTERWENVGWGFALSCNPSKSVDNFTHVSLDKDLIARLKLETIRATLVSLESSTFSLHST